MFVKRTKKIINGKAYEQASIVETIRINGKITHKQIQNLGPIKSNDDETRIKEFLEQIKKGEKLIVISNANKYILEYGIKLIVENIWNSLEIKPFLSSSKASYDISQLICMLITHRLHNYGSENLSDREAVRWINEECCRNSKLNLHQVYRGIKIFAGKEEEIEKHLWKKLHNNDEVVFYDLTSSYLEGDYSGSKIADYGYNRDKKIGKKQIVIGLLLSDNLPLAHNVWEGNTSDKTTLKEAVIQAKNIGIKKFIFVADRGLITEGNLEWIEGQKLEYIIATKRRKEILIKELMNKKIKNDEEIKKVHEEKTSEDNIRTYYLCYNKDVAEQKIKDLDSLKDILIKRIQKIKEPTEHKVLEALGKAKRLFNISFDKVFKFSINKENYEYEKQIAGKYILVTNNRKLSEKDILKTYKQLMEIERCFRQLKHFEDMRPIFHKSDDGIRAHIFIAIMALLIEKLINKKIPNMTTREVVTEMKKLKISKAGDYFVRTDISKEQKAILDNLGIKPPMKIVM